MLTYLEAVTKDPHIFLYQELTLTGFTWKPEDNKDQWKMKKMGNSYLIEFVNKLADDIVERYEVKFNEIGGEKLLDKISTFIKKDDIQYDSSDKDIQALKNYLSNRSYEIMFSKEGEFTPENSFKTMKVLKERSSETEKDIDDSKSIIKSKFKEKKEYIIDFNYVYNIASNYLPDEFTNLSKKELEDKMKRFFKDERIYTTNLIDLFSFDNYEYDDFKRWTIANKINWNKRNFMGFKIMADFFQNHKILKSYIKRLISNIRRNKEFVKEMETELEKKELSSKKSFDIYGKLMGFVKMFIETNSPDFLYFSGSGDAKSRFTNLAKIYTAFLKNKKIRQQAIGSSYDIYKHYDGYDGRSFILTKKSFMDKIVRYLKTKIAKLAPKNEDLNPNDSIDILRTIKNNIEYFINTPEELAKENKDDDE